MQNIYTTSDKKITGIQNLNINSFSYIPLIIDIKEYDALIFTSKHAVSGINHASNEWKSIPAYAIGKNTANILKEYNANLVFTSDTNYGELFANELKEKLKHKKVLYIRGTKIASNLNEILQCDEYIIYENKCHEVIKSKRLPENSYIIFTSPLLVQCFFRHYLWDSSHTAIAIGNTTAKALPDSIDVKIASHPSLKSCVEKIKTLK